MTDSRLRPLPEVQRCGLPSCLCTPPAVSAGDYGTRPAEGRLVPRGEISIGIRYGGYPPEVMRAAEPVPSLVEER